MSKQYLLVRTIENEHTTDIYSLAVTKTQILAGSGSSDVKIYSSVDIDSGPVQTLKNVDKLGSHHIATSLDGRTAIISGFSGALKIYSREDNVSSEWSETHQIYDPKSFSPWAVCLEADGMYAAATSHNGKIRLWKRDADWQAIRDYDTKGSFGMCIDMSPDGKFVASGHQDGGIYIFNNETGRMTYSLQGLVDCVRTVRFSPAGKLLAAAGNSKTIGLYDVASGEQVANFSGHSAWILSLDWNGTGEYLLSGSFDGKAKVWSIERRECVATHAEIDKALWAVHWLPKATQSERFVTAGADKSISFYREAAG